MKRYNLFVCLFVHLNFSYFVIILSFFKHQMTRRQFLHYDCLTVLTVTLTVWLWYKWYAADFKQSLTQNSESQTGVISSRVWIYIKLLLVIVLNYYLVNLFCFWMMITEIPTPAPKVKLPEQFRELFDTYAERLFRICDYEGNTSVVNIVRAGSQFSM